MYLLAAELVDGLVEGADGLLQLPLAGAPELLENFFIFIFIFILYIYFNFLEVGLHGLQVLLQLRLDVGDVRRQAGQGLLEQIKIK